MMLGLLRELGISWSTLIQCKQSQHREEGLKSQQSRLKKSIPLHQSKGVGLLRNPHCYRTHISLKILWLGNSICYREKNENGKHAVSFTRKISIFWYNTVKFYFRGSLELSLGAITMCESLRVLFNTTTKFK